MVATRPALSVSDDAAVEVISGGPEYVSRGGLKLQRALDQWAIEPTGAVALDVGASTGGFTDLLLARGTRRVYAVDVGYGQLHYRLRGDPRVVAMERTNVRYLTALPELVNHAVVDVSFISLKLALPPVFTLVADEIVALIKPQFEAGRSQVGKGGVVREAGDRRAALTAAARAAQRAGATVLGFAPSGLPGPKGNRETFVWLGEPGRAGLGDLEAAAREIEP